MAKITRTVTINGVKHWIRASTEQEYADKLLKLVSPQSAAPEPSKHLFADYALTWFETYSKPNIETVTATTYKRQLIGPAYQQYPRPYRPGLSANPGPTPLYHWRRC